MPGSGSYLQGDSVTIPGNTGNLAKTGDAFKGWNTAADGSGINYVLGSTFTMGTANLTLYAQWLTGSGTSEDPYLVANTADLQWISSNNTANTSFSGKYFKQTANIDMSYTTTATWTPIGDSTKTFSGTYDGNGYSIDHLKIYSTSPRQGVFGVIGTAGTVKDLGVTNVDITCSSNNSTTGAV